MEIGLELGKHAIVDLITVIPERSQLEEEETEESVKPYDQMIAFRIADPSHYQSGLYWDTFSTANLQDFKVFFPINLLSIGIQYVAI